MRCYSLYFCAERSRPPGGVFGVGEGSSDAEQLLELLGVRRRDLDGAGQPAGPAARLLLELVATAGALAQQLARTRDPDALLGTRVGLHLRHGYVLLVS